MRRRFSLGDPPHLTIGRSFGTIFLTCCQSCFQEGDDCGTMGRFSVIAEGQLENLEGWFSAGGPLTAAFGYFATCSPQAEIMRLAGQAGLGVQVTLRLVEGLGRVCVDLTLPRLALGMPRRIVPTRTNSIPDRSITRGLL